jgi:hypothetical protein
MHSLPFLKLTFFTTLLLSCGLQQSTIKAAAYISDTEAKLRDKATQYLALSTSTQDPAGFIEWNKCDSLLFSGLYGAAGGKVDITAARDDKMKWHRRPLDHVECYPKHSDSEISRDMLLGLLWYVWENKRLDLAEELFRYGERHKWVMGEGDITRTVFTPGLQSTLAELIFRLGGSDKKLYRKLPQAYAHNDDFAAHLDLLHILLRADMTGKINSDALEVVKYQFERVPMNPLFSYAYHRYVDQDQTETQNILLNEALFPDDRVPTTHDRCGPWLQQRDLGRSWEPCDLDEKAVTHSGGDYLFIANLLRAKWSSRQ